MIPSIPKLKLADPSVTFDSGVSCDKCRVRKVRCSRELPTCGWCTKSNIQCTYPKERHGRRKLQKIQNTGKIIFNESNQKPKHKKNELVRQNNSFPLLSLYQNEHFKLLAQISPTTPTSTELDDCIKIEETPLINTIRVQFQPHLMLILYSQLIEINPRIGGEVGWFFDKIKVGMSDNLFKPHIKMSSEWIKELYNPEFKTRTLTNYFKNFHSLVTVFGKRLFYRNLDTLNPVLLSVILFVGYQYSNNQHKELLKYLEHMAVAQLKKHFYKASLQTCQALFIFSYAIFLRGSAKQSLRYFYQACQMSSVFGIHLDINGLGDIYQNERRCVRSISVDLDQHFCNTIKLPPFYIFMIPFSGSGEPKFQIIEGTEDEAEILDAKSAFLLRSVYDKYWMPATNHLTVFTQMNELKSSNLNAEKLQKCCHFLGEMYNYCLIKSCQDFLELSAQYPDPEHTKIIQKYVWVYTSMYHQWILLVHSHIPPQFHPETKQVDYRTWRALKAVKSIYTISISNPSSVLFTSYHYLSALSFFYIKLYIISTENREFQLEMQAELSKIYNIFLKYKKNYLFPNDSLDALNEILNILNLKLN